MEKVIVGMSGGVDSAVAAYLLKSSGYDVTGVTLRTWEQGAGSRCCDIDSARSAADEIGIGYRIINCTSAFERKVRDNYVQLRLSGVTPDPCIVCNRDVKWEYLMYAANVAGASFVATGHYASVVKAENGRYTVGRGADKNKDQSYMLCRLTQQQLSRTLFPLGSMTKDEVRKTAERIGLGCFSAPDSQQLCFLPNGKNEEYLKNENAASVPGSLIDESGRFVGVHKGVCHYTIGQRRGLGVASSEPYYVKRIDAAKNVITVCRKDGLYTDEIICADAAYMSVVPLLPGQKIKARVCIRYRDPGADAEITALSDGTVSVRFFSPVRAPAPGQEAVFYDENGCVAGCAVIFSGT